MRTGYCLNDNHVGHTLSGHPEHPRRLTRIQELLQSTRLAETLTRVPTRPASREQLTRVHTRAHLDHVLEMSYRGGYLDPDTYIRDGSWDAALHAAGGVIALVEKVARGELDNGFALVRPPGHHAEANRAMGFCLFNNVAVPTPAPQAEFGLQRILIVDWDVHHGNGTQHIFYDDPTVMFFSVHQYPYYPGTGAKEERGAGPGEGTTVNVPFPGGVGDEDYILVFQRLLVPLARRFRPDIILVSAGFDPHWRDPLAAMEVTLTGFARMAEILLDLARELCHGRIVFTLEGGYDLEALAYGAINTLLVLSGQKEKVRDPLGPSPMAVRRVPHLIEALCQMWEVEDG